MSTQKNSFYRLTIGVPPWEMASMLKAMLTNEHGRKLLVFGLSKLNMGLLLAGQPIVVELENLHASLPEISIMLMGGEDEADMESELFERLNIDSSCEVTRD